MPSRRRFPSRRSTSENSRAPIKTSWLCLAITVAVLATYGRIVQHDFVGWDDDGHITENPHLDPPSWQSLVRFWEKPYFGHYVPVSYTVFTAEAWLAQSGRNEFGKLLFQPELFHADSVLLHLACTLLVFRLLLQILADRLSACVGALIFALHPLQVESVAWISEQRGLISGSFALLAISAYLKFAAGVPRDQTTKFSPFQLIAVQGATGGIGWYALATAACLLAILAKPSGASVPLMAAAVDLFLLRRSWRVSLAALLPWLMMAAAMFVITSHEQPGEALDFLPPWWTRPLIAGDALWFYLVKLVWPVDLVIQYPRAPRLVLEHSWVYFAWLGPALLLAACFARRKTGPWLFCAAWFLAVLAPVLGLIPFIYQHYSTVADRYAYLALVAPALAAAWWVSRNPSGARLAASAAVLLVLAVLTFNQSGHWADSQTLFAHTLAVNPLSDAAHGNMGAELLRRERWQEALDEFDEAFRLNPYSGVEKSLLNRGLALLWLGRVDEAIKSYEEAIARFPKCNLAHLNLSTAYVRKQDWDKTIEHSRAGLAVEPDNFPARFNLASALDKKGEPDEAIKELKTLLSYWPNKLDAHMKIASLLLKQGRTDEGLAHFAAGVEAHPDHRPARFDYAMALAAAGEADQAVAQLRRLLVQPSDDAPLIASHLAWLLATRSGQRPADALPLAEAACRQTRYQDPVPLRALAAALASGGQFTEAEKAASLALEKAAAANNASLVQALQGDLEQYRAGRVNRNAGPLVQ